MGRSEERPPTIAPDLMPGGEARMPLRVRALNDAPLRRDGAFVLYWMVAARRPHDNLALERALAHARRLDRPLLVLEALRAGYPYAADRHHAFVLQGMVDNARHFAGGPATYRAYVEPYPGAGRGLVERLAAAACVVVTDDTPVFFLPRMLAAVAPRLPVRMEAVDTHGLMPLAATEKDALTAAIFRRWVHRFVPAHLDDAPVADPLATARLPALERPPETWAPDHAFGLPGAPGAPPDRFDAAALRALPIDHRVGVVEFAGGFQSAEARLEAFLEARLDRYPDDRNHPDEDGPSRLSAALHFGHLSPHRIFRRITERAAWHPGLIAPQAAGRREGFWGLPGAAEAFLDQLLVWRELGANVRHHRPGVPLLDTLPAWARATLARHASDPRAPLYELSDFEAARTHDPLWNAAQRQLVREGYIHNYLRMLWGKKILQWSATPEDAARIMLVLNDRYALDGRDPNSECGIAWVLGRHDHPWPPERPVFGTVRYMASENTARKVRLRSYLTRYGPDSP